MTTAEPTFAAALAIVSLPKHPQQGFAPSPTSKGDAFFVSAGEADSAEATLERRNGKFPTNTVSKRLYYTMNHEPCALR